MNSSTQTSNTSFLSKPFLAVAVLAALTVSSVATAQVSLFRDDEAREKLAELEAKLDSFQIDLRKLAADTADLNEEKRDLLQLVRELSGLIEEAQLTSSRHNTRLDEIDTEIETKSGAVNKKIDTGYNSVKASLVSSDNELYDQAIKSYHRIDYKKAETSLNKLLLRYPDSTFAHASLYWLGRIQLEQDFLDVSKDTLVKLIENHPNSPRIPDALLLLEQIAVSRGDSIAAQHWQRQLLERHPVSPAADQRRAELANIKP